MRITIVEKLRPFSHLPGTYFVLPGSSLSLEIFPALIRVRDLRGPWPVLLAEIALNLETAVPVKEFTALQDLENGTLRVFGKSAAGYFRYVVKSMERRSGIIVTVEKAPGKGILFTTHGKWSAGMSSLVNSGEKVVFAENSQEVPIEEPSFTFLKERLSLGNHKQQEWESIRKRLSFTEIFPLWHRLGRMILETAVEDDKVMQDFELESLPKEVDHSQKVKATPIGNDYSSKDCVHLSSSAAISRMISDPLSKELAGTSLLLNACRQAIEAKAPEKILEQFRCLFLVGFDYALSPRLTDTSFQGVKYQGHDLNVPLGSQASAITLLTEGAKLIRSLFVLESEQVVSILPSLPPEFHCGRFLEIACGKQGSLSIEWTKKSIRCMTFIAHENQKIAFNFSNHERKCRLRTSHKDRGETYLPGSQIAIIAGQHYWFDNFV